MNNIKTIPEKFSDIKLLLFQYRPAIRLYKYAETLLDMGYQVAIANTGRTLDELDFPVPIQHINQIDVSSYDLFLSFNTKILPDGINIPVVQCVGDLVSYTGENQAEIKNLQNCSYAFFVSETQRQQAIKLVPSLRNKSAVLMNGIVPSLMPERLATKMNNGDKMTAVWAGTLSAKPEDKRFLAPIFDEFAELYDLHIYPSFVEVDMSAYQGSYTIHEPVKPTRLIYELSKYEVGLILWNKITYELTCSLPNKFFEYQAAGLMVVHNYNRDGEITKQKNACHVAEHYYGMEIKGLQKPLFYADQSSILEKGLTESLGFRL